MRIGRLAPWYRWIEYAAFGRVLERGRYAFLPRMSSARRILILGEGDGRMLARLFAIAPAARIDVIEISPEMVALAKGRAGMGQKVDFQCVDARSAVFPPGHYDGIVTNFFLDCFTEREVCALVGRLAVTLKPDGIWLMAEFATPSSGWGRVHAHVWIRTMYLFFRAATGLRVSRLPPITRIMKECGLKCTERRTARAGLMVSEVWRHADYDIVTPLLCDEQQTSL